LLGLLEELHPLVIDHQGGKLPENSNYPQSRIIIDREMKKISKRTKNLRLEINGTLCVVIDSSHSEWRRSIFGDKSLIMDPKDAMDEARLFHIDESFRKFEDNLCKLRARVMTTESCFSEMKHSNFE